MDTTVFGKSNVPGGYSIEMFKGSSKKPLTNPVTYQQLDEDIVAISTYTTPISSFFMLVYPQQKQSAVNVGSSSGQQQATLSNSSECRVLQDPYGRVFDSNTNEPLSNASVELSKKDSNGKYNKVTTSDTLVRIQNPQITEEDGMFSFDVVDGVYRLVAEKVNYLTGKTADIYQSGKAVRVDIPLVPQDIAQSEEYARKNPIKVMNYLQSINKKTRVYVIEGQLTHPNAAVAVYSNKKDALARTTADASGHFILQFPLSKVKQGQSISQLIATKKKYGNTAVITLDPVFDSVKGYAYDDTGKLIPGAKVAVMLPFSTKPAYETTADANGFFRVPSGKLPPIAYSFTFTSLSGAKDSVSTGSFIAQNIAHTNTNKYVALNSDDTGNVMGAYTESPMSTGSEQSDVHSKILLGAFVVLLIMAIPLSRMYTKADGKRKKK